MRLGSWDCNLIPNSKSAIAYQKHINERHRHRYEFKMNFQIKFLIKILLFQVQP